MQDSEFYINLGHAELLGLPPGQDHVNLRAFTTSDELRERALRQIVAQLRNDLTSFRTRQQLDRRRREKLQMIEPTDQRNLSSSTQENADELILANRLRANVEASMIFLNVAFGIPSSRSITRGSLKDCTLPGYAKDRSEPLPFTYDQFSIKIRQAFTQEQLLTSPQSDRTNKLTPLGETIRALSFATQALYPPAS